MELRIFSENVSGGGGGGCVCINSPLKVVLLWQSCNKLAIVITSIDIRNPSNHILNNKYPHHLSPVSINPFKLKLRAIFSARRNWW